MIFNPILNKSIVELVEGKKLEKQAKQAEAEYRASTKERNEFRAAAQKNRQNPKPGSDAHYAAWREEQMEKKAGKGD